MLRGRKKRLGQKKEIAGKDKRKVVEKQKEKREKEKEKDRRKDLLP